MRIALAERRRRIWPASGFNRSIHDGHFSTGVSDNAVEAQRRKEKRTDALNELKNKNRDLKDNFQYLQDYVDQVSGVDD